MVGRRQRTSVIWAQVDGLQLEASAPSTNLHTLVLGGALVSGKAQKGLSHETRSLGGGIMLLVPSMGLVPSKGRLHKLFCLCVGDCVGVCVGDGVEGWCFFSLYAQTASGKLQVC